jgi:hypothetical protein
VTGKFACQLVWLNNVERYFRLLIAKSWSFPYCFLYKKNS